ncbi:MAG: hypothetical protein AAFW60_13640, partial [Pseudomonadota bacterium]
NYHPFQVIMSNMSKRATPSEQLAKLEKKKTQLDARIQQKKAQVRTQQRKDDTRRKIIAGALALEHMAHDNKFRGTMEKLIESHVATREKDAKLFDL